MEKNDILISVFSLAVAIVIAFLFPMTASKIQAEMETSEKFLKLWPLLTERPFVQK